MLIEIDAATEAKGMKMPMASSSQGEPLARGQFADLHTLLDQLAFKPGNTVLGEYEGQLLGYGDDCGAFICGSTRSGKGWQGISTLSQAPGSVFVSTCKNDLAAVLLPRRGAGDPRYCDGLGQKCRLYDPFNLLPGWDDVRAKFNPLDLMVGPHGASYVRLAALISGCILPRDNGKEEYFVKDARRIIKWLTLHVRTYPAFENRRHLGTVYDLITEGDVIGFELLKSRDLLGPDDTPHTVMCVGLIDNPACGGIICRAGRYLLSMLRTAARQWQGVQSEAAEALGFLDDEGVRDMLSATTGDLADLKFDPQGLSVFVIIDEFLAPNVVAVPRLFFTCAFMLMKRPGRPATGHNVKFWIDEFAALGRVEVIEQAMNTAAGYSASITLVSQNINQLAINYGQEVMHSILSACSLRVLLDCRDTVTAEEFQKLCGEKEVLVLNNSLAVSEGKNESTGKGSNWQLNTSYQTSHGKQIGASHTDGTNSGGSLGRNGQHSVGHNIPGGLLWRLIPKCLRAWWSISLGESSGWQDGTNWGTNASDTTNESQNEGFSRGGGASLGGNASVTLGSQRSVTSTVNEARQVRPLVPLAEVIRKYAKFRPDGSPAQNLVHICGMFPIELNRVAYWKNPQFYRCYGKDPEYPFLQAPQQLCGKGETKRKPVVVEQLNKSIQEIEQRLEAGADYYFLRIPGYILMAGVLPLGLVMTAPDLVAVSLLGTWAIYRRARDYASLLKLKVSTQTELRAAVASNID